MIRIRRTGNEIWDSFQGHCFLTCKTCVQIMPKEIPNESFQTSTLSYHQIFILSLIEAKGQSQVEYCLKLISDFE